MSATPTFRLLREPPRPLVVPVLDANQRAVVDHRGGLLRVLAGPGTGKTTTLVEAVVDRVDRRAVPIGQILLLTFSRAAAGELRDRVTARLQRTISQPTARTFHSYAFGIVRKAAVLAGEPPPRLLSGSEQEVTVRELFAGRVADGRTDWPAELDPASRTRAFTDELRELLIRAIERDVSPAELVALGRKHDRADWIWAAGMLSEYLDVTALKAPGAFDAAELIQRAKAELLANPELLNSERAARRRIFVDEFQDTDPAQIELLKLIARGADELVLMGDPDQAIYSFRGAEQNAMSDIEAQFGGLLARTMAEGESKQSTVERPLKTVSLAVCRRSGTNLVGASRGIAARLGGGVIEHRALVPAPALRAGSVTVEVFSSASAETAFLATALRRAHVEDGIPWSEMAVLVRSAGPGVDSLRRGLAAAGVPVGQPVRGALVSEPAVAHLLALLRCVAQPSEITAGDAELLLTGPVGRADPLQLLRIVRALRVAEDGGIGLNQLLAEPGAAAFVPPSVRSPVERTRAVIEAGLQASLQGAPAEDVLWAVWSASRLSERLEARSLAGGPDGARADRDLDAVLALFAEAAKVSERSPGAGPQALYRWVSELQITDADATPRPRHSETVAILTAHASKGLEWELVCVAGVQDGSWPNLRRRGSLLGGDLLVDVLAGRAAIATGLLNQRLAEERRLFYVAITRARSRLLVTAQATEDAQPSRFLDELDPLPDGLDRRPVHQGRRPFALPGIVAELRAALLTPGIDEHDRCAAALQLARLATAGVPGAHPDDWWGLAPLSTEAPIRAVDAGPVPIRPSKFEAYSDCELRALLTEVAAVDGTDNVAASLGSLVHTVAEQAAADATEAELTSVLERGWPRLEFEAPWHEVNERARAQRMLVELLKWLRSSRSELTELGRELPFRVEIDDAVLSGKVDRLERDASGRLVVVDFKTGKNKPSGKDVAEHAQLAAYQLAVASGAFTDGQTAEAGGAVLVHVGANVPGVQRQATLADFADPDWVRRELARIAAVLRGSSVTARPGQGCTRCPVRLSCPAQGDGQQVVS